MTQQIPLTFPAPMTRKQLGAARKLARMVAAKFSDPATVSYRAHRAAALKGHRKVHA